MIKIVYDFILNVIAVLKELEACILSVPVLNRHLSSAYYVPGTELFTMKGTNEIVAVSYNCQE